MEREQPALWKPKMLGAAKSRKASRGTRSLTQRLYGYARPSSSQRTNQQLNALLLEKLGQGELIEIYCATPPDLSWNGFRISGPIGLETGLIDEFGLPLNIRGS